jgi:uncharacterized metal-binding protein
MDYPRCDRCGGRECRTGEEMRNPNCPSNVERMDEEEIAKMYMDEEERRIYHTAAKIEKETYRNVEGAITPVRPRIAEVLAFCREMGIQRVGVAFCSGLIWEASKVCRILENGGLDVASVMCKCFSVEKQDLGVPKEDYIRPGEEKACNPIMQAELLNKAGTQLNLIVGLCLGHDILFTRHSNAMVTTLVVKDRMTGHNPIPSLYSAYFDEIIEREGH